jgi:uncharacterized protein
MSFLVTAVTLGCMGSLHCLGMCGPIALALPGAARPATARLFNVMLYNLGRIFTYALFGSLVGLLGKGLELAGLQRFLSVASGVLVLAVLATHRKWLGSFVPAHLYSKINGLKSKLRHYMQFNSKPALFLIGVLNGFLPCGLVYIALAAAVSTASPQEGALFMALFGLGTVPLMSVMALSRNLLTATARKGLSRMVPYFITVMACLLILRGLNLDIPYLSPASAEGKMKCCTEKNCKP